MNNLLIKCLKSEKIESGSIYERFHINSLCPGQGLTIGNLIRRILLNDLGGMAITGIKFHQTYHEFSIIPSIREDILEILLNLKGIVFKSSTKDCKFGSLKIKGPAIITANCIELPSDLSIVNPHHYIATIVDSEIIEINFKIEYGVGYKLANRKSSINTNDFIETDAIFMPIHKMNFEVKEIYENSKLRNEDLFLDIWTNGSITPKKSILLASTFIIDLFTKFLKNKFNEKLNKLDIKKENLVLNSRTDIMIEELQLSVRAYNCLKRENINTMGDLLKYSPERLQELKNFGRKSADEVFMTLKNKLGIVLK